MKCARDGIYSISASVYVRSTANASQGSFAFVSVDIGGSYSAKVPVASFQQKTSEWRFNKTDGACFVAHLAEGDSLKAAGANSNVETYVSVSLVRIG